MAKKKAKIRNTRRLVQGYLERTSSKVFADFPKQITDLISGRHGVYALYKENRLYYVGLATNLKRRVKYHLRDKHAGKWDKFSLYLVRKVDHIKELESLILRISDPTGNAVKGGLHQATNIQKELLRNVKLEQDRQRRKLFGGRTTGEGRRHKTSTSKKKVEKSGRKPTLAPYVDKWFFIYSEYKGRKYKATVRSNGTIKYKGKLYNSPTLAGVAIVKRTVNGWLFWKYKLANGKFAILSKLRK